MSRFQLIMLVTACILAAMTSTLSSAETVSYGTIATCKFPFFFQNSWWNTCVAIGNDKPWCILKDEHKQPPPANDWLTCDESLVANVTALVGGVPETCTTRSVDGKTIFGCNSASQTGSFTCLTKKGEIGTCMTPNASSKIRNNNPDANVKSLGTNGASNNEGDGKSGVSYATIIPGTIAGVAAIGLVVGLFIYRRRRSGRASNWRGTEQRSRSASMGSPVLPVPAAAAIGGRRDSAASSQMFSPVSPGERLYPVVSTYTPTLGDELEIQPGDKVSILIEYDDGWCQGINHTRGGLKGVFPKHCVDMSGAGTSADSSMRLSSEPPTSPLNV